MAQWIIKGSLSIILALALSLNGCYYDNEEELYPLGPGSPACDTSAVSYQAEVLPILQTHCFRCHGSTTGFGNVMLEGYSKLQTYVQSGQLLGAIRHEPGFSAMPRNANKLPDCSIHKVEAWIRSGALDN